jgi:TatD DNase family protein
MGELFDTHAHLLDDAFFKDRKAVIQSLIDAGLKGMVECGTDEEESAKAVRLTEKLSFVYAAVGVHPHGAAKASKDYLSVLTELAKNKKVVAIGEIGLDYHYDYSPRDVQREVFEAQILLAAELSKPVIVHMREATEDTLEILKKHAPLRGVMHCFSGSAETVAECLKMGLYISFSGSVTFKSAVHVREAAKAVPMDRLLAETDCPYMAPEPFRGTRNEPLKVETVLQKLAQIKSISFDEMCAVNIKNAKKLFGIEEL